MACKDQRWIGKTLDCNSKGALTAQLKSSWYPPPTPAPNTNAVPCPEDYFLRRLFLRMPKRMWGVDLKCPTIVYVQVGCLTLKISIIWQQNIILTKDITAHTLPGTGDFFNSCQLMLCRVSLWYLHTNMHVMYQWFPCCGHVHWRTVPQHFKKRSRNCTVKIG